MIPLTLARVARATGGVLADVPDPDARVTGPVVADSRRVQPGSLFVALEGEHADGHDFVRAAAGAGAVAALTARPVGVPAVVVGDVVPALAGLARAVVDRLPGVAVVGVTGSSGKTTTKDLLAQVLGRLGPTVAPEASYNNEIGHPLTVLRADEATRYLVLELSARGPGHIAHLAGIAPPRFGVVLNVGTAHLGEFGSREAIARAKGELVEALPAEGLAVLNADDPLVRAMAARTRARVVTYGVSAEADVRATDVSLDDLGRAGFTLVVPEGSAPVRLRLHGGHNVSNALAVAAVARALGMSVTGTAAALGKASAASRWRMEVRERGDGVTVVNDAYNANPDSTAAALRALLAIAHGRRTWAVLGEMAELGEASRDAHETVGALATRLGVSRLVVVGEAARAIADGARRERAGEEPTSVPDADAAVAVLRERLRPGDVVLVKGSRVVGLERVAMALLGEAVAA